MNSCVWALESLAPLALVGSGESYVSKGTPDHWFCLETTELENFGAPSDSNVTRFYLMFFYYKYAWDSGQLHQSHLYVH